MRRVVVTGIGAVTPIGIGSAGLWEGVHQPLSGVCRITRFDASALHCQVAGEVHGFHPEEWIPGEKLSQLDRYSRFCVASARMAVEDAAIDMSTEDRERVGCYIGSALGGVSFGEIQYRNYHSGGLESINPILAQATFVGAGGANVALDLGIRGPNSSNADSCASGPVAMGRAMNAIRRGQIDMAISGAAEAPLTPLVFGAFDVIRAMSTHYNDTPERACRPFDSGRDGFIMGEGAAMVVLESEEHARRRGARILAELCGYGLTNDAHHMTAPRQDGREAARAIGICLEDAGCRPDDIDVVSGHGSSTPLNDPTETKVLKQALGEHAYHIPIVATKSRHAHSLGASGAIEIAIFALGLFHQWLPRALNLDEPAAECDLDYARSGPVVGPFRTALSTSFGFGGINACMVLRAYEAS